ncbi:hypothetical protein TeGR_g10139 [Tetraparma gracilis]|uniref:Uncharacterized protein n=1 Tax=Tetraparma gracilis TaxID=2962635 RepID=A0ABQ6MA03_9STRA|nr:hypothetical protein TeGR_g10139 [Tetraparma gracilis]
MESSIDRRLFGSHLDSISGSVVGLVPQSLAGSLAPPSGAAPPVSVSLSPLADLAVAVDPLGCSVSVWQHSTATATQPILAPCCVTFGAEQGLRYGPGPGDLLEPHDLAPGLAALAPAGQEERGAPTPLFLATSLGFCFYYPNSLSATSPPTCLQLPLPARDEVACVAYSPGAHAFFAGTAGGDVYIVAVRTRPLSLRARKLVAAGSLVAEGLKSVIGGVTSLFRKPEPAPDSKDEIKAL